MNYFVHDYISAILNLSHDKINEIILNYKNKKTSIKYAKDCYKYE